MIWFQQNLHILIIFSVAFASALLAVLLLLFMIRRLAKAPKFAAWLDEIASEESGKGSAKRFCGIVGFMCTEVAFLYGYAELCHKAAWEPAQKLFDANAWLVGATLGLVAGVTAATKFKSGDPAPAGP